MARARTIGLFFLHAIAKPPGAAFRDPLGKEGEKSNSSKALMVDVEISRVIREPRETLRKNPASPCAGEILCRFQERFARQRFFRCIAA